MRVGREVSGRPEWSQELSQQSAVAIGRVDDRRAWLLDPGVDQIEGFVEIERRLEYARVGAEPDEGEQHRPGERERLRTGEPSFQPAPRAFVMRRGLVDRVQQEIDVDQLHLRSSSLRIVSASSSSP